MIKGLLVGAGVFLVGFALGGFLLVKPGERVVERVLSGSSGTEHTQFERFMQGSSQGGDTVTFTSTSTPMTAAQFCLNRNVQVSLPNLGIGNLTLPSTTQIFAMCLNSVNDKLITTFKNNTSTGSFSLAPGDSSSTVVRLYEAVGSSTSPTYQATTSSFQGGTIGVVTSLRTVSGTDPWLVHFVEIFR